MFRALVTPVLLFSFTILGWSQAPLINYRGVANAASFMPQGLPGGGIAQGSVFTIFGSRLGPGTPVAATGFPLGNALGNVSIRVFQGNTSVNALPLFVSASQINAIMPSNTPAGMVSVQVTYNNAKSNPSPVRVVANALGIFTANGAGLGPGILQNLIAPNQPAMNTLLAPATPNQSVTLWGTGLGPINGGDNLAPPDGNLPTQVELFVGGQQASVKSSGRSSCCAGVDQITFTVPANAPLGCWVPVLVRTGGTTVSNGATMAISADGSPCAEPSNPLSKAYIQGGNIGLLTLLRASIHEEVVTARPVDVTTDFYLNNTTQEEGGPLAFDPFLSEPPAGSCTIISEQGDYFAGDPIGGARTSVRRLDYGPPFRLTGPRGTITLTEFYSGSGSGAFGSSLSGYNLPNGLYLDPGSYTLIGNGGPDIGPFQAALTMPAAFTWTNRDQTIVVDRSRALTVAWSGAPAGQTMAVLGVNVDVPTNSTAIFYCIASPGAASLTVPPAVLSNLPATRLNPLQSKGAIYVTNMPLANAVPFTAQGLDAAAARSVLTTGRYVIFR